MPGWHQTIVVGNLGRDPELRYTQSGRAVCGFTVAVNETWTDRQSNEKREKVTWYQISAWGPLGETCQKFLSKERQVMVIGTVEARGYTNNAGESAASLQLTAREVRFLSSAGDGAGSGDDEYRRSTDEELDRVFGPVPTDKDNIPF